MNLIYLNQQVGSYGGPQVWSSRFQAILEERGFRFTSNLKANWDSAIFVNDTQGMDQALKTGRPVVYRVANGYLPAWFKLMNREMKAQHHLVNSKVAFGLEFANTVIYQSHWAKESLDENLFQRKYGSAVIYNGVDLKRFIPAAEHSPSNIQRPVVIGTVGRLRYRFRLETFLKMSRLIKIPHTLLIVGGLDTENSQVLKTYQADPLIGPRITYQEQVSPEKLPELFQSMDILVHPVCGDVCPNVVVEALACGVPVVAPQFGGSAELIGKAGMVFECQPWVYDSGFIEAMADAATRTLIDTKRLSLLARQRSEQLFDLGVMADRYLETMGLSQSALAGSDGTGVSNRGVRERYIFQLNRWRKMISIVKQKAQRQQSQFFPVRIHKKTRIAFIQSAYGTSEILEVLNHLADTLHSQYDFYFLETGDHSRPDCFGQYPCITDPSELVAFLQKEHIDILQINGQRWIVDAALAAGIEHIIVYSESAPNEFPGSRRGIAHWINPIDDISQAVQKFTQIYQDLTNDHLVEG